MGVNDAQGDRMADEPFGLTDFSNEVDELSEKILRRIYGALLEEAKVRDEHKTVSSVVFDNAALRASMFLVARVVSVMHYGSNDINYSEDDFEQYSADVFGDVMPAMIPVLEKHVRAVFVRKDTRGNA
jgi:hypothetical protein